ncbi:MAG: NAD-binding protein [Sulfurospirillaceae bacterium]|nr:NAD-binding protein [Sulfurospirillaceae bacterium]
MLARLIITFAYFLNSSNTYKKAKSYIYDLLENPRSKIKPYFDYLIIFLVFSTVAILIYDIGHHIPYHFELVENFAVSVFIFEWIGRFWISSNLRTLIIQYHEKMLESSQKPSFFYILKIITKKKLQYVVSPMSIIDLLAILPTFRPLRILRVFLIFRLLKIFRYTKSLNSFFSILKDKNFEFKFLFLLGVFTIFMSSTIMYVFEGTGNNPHINSYLDAVYWSVITISTVGYGDITPVTLIGKIVTVFLISGGFLILILATSIVTNALSEKIEIVRENKFLTKARKLSNLIVIVGFGRMGQALAEELNKINKNFIVIDVDNDKIQNAKNLGYLYMQDDASNYDTINNIVFENDVEKVVISTENDALNLSILLTIKAEKSDIEVIVRSNSYENIKKFKIAKADHVVFPYETVAEVAVEYIGNSVRFDAIDNILLRKNTITLDEIDILEGSDFVGKNIEDLGINDLDITIIAILKEGNLNNFIFNPDHVNYKFEVNDILIVVGDEKQTSKVRNEITRQLA